MDDDVGVTSKKVTFESLRTGPGLATVTWTVPGVATSEAGTLAVKRDRLTNLVGNELPFHFTTAPETNPVPLTVSTNAAPPGLTASGTRGWLMKGTGFCAIAA